MDEGLALELLGIEAGVALGHEWPVLIFTDDRHSSLSAIARPRGVIVMNTLRLS